jgi:hypothetical protein
MSALGTFPRLSLHPPTPRHVPTPPLLLTDRMDQHITAWQQAGDARHVFLQCYGLMTRNVLTAVEQGEFHHPAWVHTLLHRFADYYFTALDAYERGDAHTPAVWHYTFQATTEHRLHVLQQLFLGVNAHINYDLVLTLLDMLGPEWRDLDDAARRRFHADHCHINTVIERTIDVVQDDVIERVSPSMNVVDTLLGRADEWMIAQLIRSWRGAVWTRSCTLLAAHEPAERARLMQCLERDVMRTAQRIAFGVPGTRAAHGD